jgi:glutamate---cysteine ligase / carboxylate-amine ligase
LCGGAAGAPPLVRFTPASIVPMKAPSLTLGVEEEYQIIDPVSRDLVSYVTQLLAEDHRVLTQVKPELHQSIIEVGTNVCQTPAEVRKELIMLRKGVMELAAKKGYRIAAAGTHPFANWQTQEITPYDHYLGTRNDMGDLAQRLLIFGTHVHIGIEDKDFLVDACNVARYFLPHILCLTSSSPFWYGRETGLRSYRSVVFRAFPRSGVPPLLNSYYDYTSYIDTLIETGSIPGPHKIWWDIRPHGKYPTLEFRVCDVCTRVDEAVSIAAILQALIAKLYKMRRDNTTFRVYSSALIEENKWRAVRYGLGDELGTRTEVEYAYKILAEGSSADRQLATFARTNDLRAVVDQLIVETAEGVMDVPAAGPMPAV